MAATSERVSWTTAASPDMVAALIQERRTIHDFAATQAPEEILRRGLDLARWAPNHHLSQPWHFYLLGKETARAVAELNASLVERKNGPEAAAQKLERWSAMPGWLVVTCDRSEDAIRHREDYAACCCAIHSLALYLWSEGIGLKWTTGPVTREADFCDLLWIDPEMEEVVGLLWYGYATEVAPAHRKSLDECLVSLP